MRSMATPSCRTFGRARGCASSPPKSVSTESSLAGRHSTPSSITQRPRMLRPYACTGSGKRKAGRPGRPPARHVTMAGTTPRENSRSTAGGGNPCRLARIASRFNPHRKHPELHIVVPHNGVDFAAPAGAPVYAAASGVVTSVGPSGPCGNKVEIAHTGGITTAYCHLSRFAAGLKVGQRVEQRQLIAYVGQTGRVTGPHLHFAVKRNGSFIDPMTLRLDGERVVPRWATRRLRPPAQRARCGARRHLPSGVHHRTHRLGGARTGARRERNVLRRALGGRCFSPIPSRSRCRARSRYGGILARPPSAHSVSTKTTGLPRAIAATRFLAFWRARWASSRLA